MLPVRTQFYRRNCATGNLQSCIEPPQLLFDIMSNDNKWLLLVQLHAMFLQPWSENMKIYLWTLARCLNLWSHLTSPPPLSPNLCQWCTNSLSKQSLIWEFFEKKGFLKIENTQFVIFWSYISTLPSIIVSLIKKCWSMETCLILSHSS